MTNAYIMRILIGLSVILTTLLFSCKNMDNSNVEKWKQEILETEHQFAKMAHEKGVPAAFLAYADNGAVLLRNNKLVIGLDALKEHYSSQGSDTSNSSLTWEPEFIEVSKLGDLGYTYGYYTYTILDSTNKEIVSKGVFHTIWKRQDDETWKFVWD